MTGQELKYKLIEAGKSQKDIAELLGVTAQSLSSVLSAKDVRSGTIERIADALGVQMSFFYPTEGSGVSIAGNNNISGNNNAVGNVTIGDAAVLQERVKSLEALLAEKERLIKVYEKMVSK